MNTKSVLTALSAFAVFFTIYQTQHIPTSYFKLGDDIPYVLCKMGVSTLHRDPLFNLTPRVIDNISTVFGSALLVLVVSYTILNRFKVISMLLNILGYSVLVVSIIAFYRESPGIESREMCAKTADTLKGILTQETPDRFAPAFSPLSYLPSSIPGLPASHPIQQTYQVGIYPYISEYLFTIQPFMVEIYTILGIILLIRPLNDIFWDNYLSITTLAGLGVMALSFGNETNPFDAPDPLIILALKAVIFVLFSLGSTVLVLASSRIVGQRLSVFSVIFLVVRAHKLGVPYFGLHVDIFIVIALLVILHRTCDPSRGVLLLWGIALHVFHFPIMEWALFIRLLDNFILSFIQSYFVRSQTVKVKSE